MSGDPTDPSFYERRLLEKQAEANRSPIMVRYYQDGAINAVFDAWERQIERVLITLPTGMGKTITFAELLRRAIEEREYADKALILAHRDELLDQADQKIKRVAPQLMVGIEAAERRAGSFDQIVAASVQTIGRTGSKRLDWFEPGIIVTDEAHHSPADTYTRIYDQKGVYDGRCLHLGVTATEKRLDNKPLHGVEHAIYQELVYSFPLTRAIRENFLVDIRGYVVRSGVDLSDVKTVAGDYNQAQLSKKVDTPARNNATFKEWANVAKDRKTIIFACSVQHAKNLQAIWEAAGVPCGFVDGETKKEDRRRVIRDFASGKVRAIANCGVLTEGFDEPSAASIVMARPTQSWALYVQMVGRGLRLLGDDWEQSQANGKRDCIVIDVADNTGRHSLVSVPAIIDLPGNLDLEGHSLIEAATMMDELGSTSNLAVAQPTTFRELKTTLEQVDMLAETQQPPEIAKHTRFDWLAMPGGQWFLRCGDHPGEGRREAKVTVDALGQHLLHLTKGEKNAKPIRLGDTLSQAIRDADRLITKYFAEVGRYASKDSKWQKERPSPSQVALLKRLHVNDGVIAAMTKGQASNMITAKIQRIKAKGGNF